MLSDAEQMVDGGDLIRTIQPVSPLTDTGKGPAPQQVMLLDDDFGGGGGGGGGTPPPDDPPPPGTNPPLPSDPPPPDETIPYPDPADPTESRPGAGGVTVQELYPEMPELGDINAPTVADPTGAGVTESDFGVTEFGTAEAGGVDVAGPAGAGVTEGDFGVTQQDTAQAADAAVSAIEKGVTAVQGVGTGEQTALTAEQQVDAELTRILGADSPLLAQARAQAMQIANSRGLMNSSMATGMAMDAMTKAALPMAQQNADQAFKRESENTRLRQEAGLFSAEEEGRLRALEAELGQDLSVFNADQLNQAERLSAEMRTALEQGNMEAYNTAATQLADLQRDAERQQAELSQETSIYNADQQNEANRLQAELRAALEQGNTEAYNDASMQLADLQREAESQQAELDFAADEREFLEKQAYNEKIIDSIARMNERFMIGEQQVDINHIVGQYGQLTSTNESAARIMDSYLGAIGGIFDDPKMSSSQAQEAIRNMVKMMEGSLRMIAEMNGMEFDVDF